MKHISFDISNYKDKTANLFKNVYNFKNLKNAKINNVSYDLGK